ncbi:hypothetical protein PROFUN_11747 [Planoprotostelium fungivorum]|uniref:mRNA m(6)A methyltransferase n=1 Tax=Planoprotostelium fungivorum TaxID=1890364 RepID=A0A2P6MYF7_9EUKA|nr:hypothetical protein PROFUN_11747 [Planoprotostelium fungivorum]
MSKNPNITSFLEKPAEVETTPEGDDEVDLSAVVSSDLTKEDILNMDHGSLLGAMQDIQSEIAKLEEELGETAYDEDDENDENNEELELFRVPEFCIPIRKDVRMVDWDAIAKEVQFDVITMDPPWQLASSNPTRGVAIGYKQLPNKDIMDIPIHKLQSNGFLFIWVINARYTFALEMFERWGYELVDDITWVKTTVHRRMAKGHGFYLQHAKETCLVGRKGKNPPGTTGNIGSDVIFAERRGQSQKPEEIYELCETLVPNGRYLEIFARRNNLRNYWVSIGNEL